MRGILELDKVKANHCEKGLRLSGEEGQSMTERYGRECHRTSTRHKSGTEMKKTTDGNFVGPIKELRLSTPEAIS